MTTNNTNRRISRMRIIIKDLCHSLYGLRLASHSGKFVVKDLFRNLFMPRKQVNMKLIDLVFYANKFIVDIGYLSGKILETVQRKKN